MLQTFYEPDTAHSICFVIFVIPAGRQRLNYMYQDSETCTHVDVIMLMKCVAYLFTDIL